MEKPIEVSSALKDDTLDKDIDDASSSYSDDVETTFEPVESEELSDLSDTSSSGSHEFILSPHFAALLIGPIYHKFFQKLVKLI